MSLTGIEKEISHQLERFPIVKNRISSVYHKVNYLIFGDYGLTAETNPDVELMTPATWAGVNEQHEGEFFGYYDKTPWSPNTDQAVFHNLKGGQQLDIVVYDREYSERRIISDTQAWNYQQGSMVQWLSNEQIIFNDIEEEQLVSKIVTTNGDQIRQLSLPIQTVHSDSRSALCINYRRLDSCRPQYGYSTEVDNFSTTQDPTKDGIWYLDLNSGRSELLVTLQAISEFKQRNDADESSHWLNHIFYSPDGDKCVFMYRWQYDGDRRSRLFLYDIKSDSLELLLDDDKVAHYCWVGNNTVLVWGKHPSHGMRYYLIDTETNTVEPLHSGRGISTYGDGHPSFSPVNELFITDTYPGRDRVQQLLLFDKNTESIITLGRFFAPLEFSDSYSCDLHPRWSPCGQFVSIDSAHTGTRGTYMLRVNDLNIC